MVETILLQSVWMENIRSQDISDILITVYLYLLGYNYN